MTTVRRWCGAAAILFVGLTAGCKCPSKQGKCEGCKEATTCCAAATTAPKAVAESGQPTLLPPKDVAEKSQPAPETPMATRNERYVTPLVPQRPASLPAPTAPALEAPTTVAPAKPSLLPPPPVSKTDDGVRIPPIAGTAYKATRTVMTPLASMGRSPDYSVLTGELSYIAHKNQWRLRFASIDEEDRYGGSVTIDAVQEMKEFHSGDLVTIRGELINRDSREVAPLYRMHDIVAVKR